jgi:hypothetical protein
MGTDGGEAAVAGRRGGRDLLCAGATRGRLTQGDDSRPAAS